MTVGDIRDKVNYKLNTYKDLPIEKIIEKVTNEMRDYLLYYYSTDEGRKEIMNSPHYHLKVEDAVELLMQDVDLWINKELGLDGETTK